MQKQFKNTFAPHVVNQFLTLEQIIQGLHARVFKFDKLPPEVQKLVKVHSEKSYDNGKKDPNESTLDQ